MFFKKNAFNILVSFYLLMNANLYSTVAEVAGRGVLIRGNSDGNDHARAMIGDFSAADDDDEDADEDAAEENKANDKDGADGKEVEGKKNVKTVQDKNAIQDKKVDQDKADQEAVVKNDLFDNKAVAKATANKVIENKSVANKVVANIDNANEKNVEDGKAQDTDKKEKSGPQLNTAIGKDAHLKDAVKDEKVANYVNLLQVFKQFAENLVMTIDKMITNTNPAVTPLKPQIPGFAQLSDIELKPKAPVEVVNAEKIPATVAQTTPAIKNEKPQIIPKEKQVIPVKSQKATIVTSVKKTESPKTQTHAKKIPPIAAFPVVVAKKLPTTMATVAAAPVAAAVVGKKLDITQNKVTIKINKDNSLEKVDADGSKTVINPKNLDDKKGDSTKVIKEAKAKEEKKKKEEEEEKKKVEQLEKEKKKKEEQKEPVLSLEQIQFYESMYSVMKKLITGDFATDKTVDELDMYITKNKIVFNNKHLNRLIIDAIHMQNKKLALRVLTMLKEKNINFAFKEEKTGMNILMYAIGMEETTDIIKFILAANVIDLVDIDELKETALIKAIKLKNLQFVKLLLDADSKKDTILVTNAMNQTPLIISINMLNNEIFDVLFSNDANFVVSKLRDANGDTPLIHAVKVKAYDILQKFVDKQDLFIDLIKNVNNSGQSAFSIASENVDFKALKILLNRRDKEKVKDALHIICNTIDNMGCVPMIILIVKANMFRSQLQAKITNTNDEFLVKEFEIFNMNYQIVFDMLKPFSKLFQENTKLSEIKQAKLDEKPAVVKVEEGVFDKVKNFINGLFNK